MSGTAFTLKVQPVIPAPIARLPELASNLLYSWDRNVRRLFFEMDTELWDACGHNPKLVLRRVAQARLDAAAEDPDFLERYRAALVRLDACLTPMPDAGSADATPHVAYFCMEFGIHESVGLYSGGLGILAGDYCKAASHGAVPFTAVGLMYRLGYFEQTIDRSGAQQAQAHVVDPDELPVTEVLDARGQPLRVAVAFPDRWVTARVWRAQVGRVALYLLDSDTPENSAADRSITHQLYGGDRQTRIAQELLLGIGGVRVLRALGLTPEVWHINEGHAAFLILELCREAVAAGLPFAAAWERVAASVVFTTHTPVAAGHDRFDRDLASRHLAPIAGDMGVPVERLLACGQSLVDGAEFNMTTLALRGSRHCNGVSRIHGEVASNLSAYIWPQIDPAENPMQYVTNGVHVPTFLAREWSDVFDHINSAWRSKLCATQGYWRELIGGISDHGYWSLRQTLKSSMLSYVAGVLERQYQRMNASRSRIENMRRALCSEDQRALVIGFARRFTSYKRPLLLLRDRDRLARLLTNPERPLLIVFAGKAHPHDGEGQAMIRALNELAAQPPFLGKLYFVEDYNIALARELVTGVDVWLNTPDYPQEASGTSGQKAAINGVINLSVLDGWWPEAFDGNNGWAIVPQDRRLSAQQRDDLESEDLLALIEDQVMPAYFERNGSGVPTAWIARAKASMASVLPQFNADRMLADYSARIYRPAARLARAHTAAESDLSRQLADWKTRVVTAWDRVVLRWSRPPPSSSNAGQVLPIQVAVQLDGLSAADVAVECILEVKHVRTPRRYRIAFHADPQAATEQRYSLELVPPAEGVLSLRVRAYPTHPALAHPFETGLMRWLE